MRKKYNSSEKAKIALEAIKVELTQAQLTAKYDIHTSQVKAWKKQVLEALPDIFSDKRKRSIVLLDILLN